MAWIVKRECKNGVSIKLKTGKTIIGKYFVADRGPDGSIVYDGEGGYMSWAAAQIGKSKFEQSQRDGTSNIDKNSITLSQAAEARHQDSIANGLAESTLHNEERYYAKLCDFKKYGDRKISTITLDDMDKFKASLSGNHCGNGKAIIFRTISPIWTYAIEHGFAKTNVCRKSGNKIKEEAVARFLTSDEVGTLYNACRFSPRGELADIVRVGLYTGMRIGEVLSRTGADIRDGHISVPCNKTYRNKTREPRMIPIHKKIAHIIARAGSGRIFQGWSRDRAERAFGRAVKRAKFGEFRFHDLRHTFASTYLQAGGTLADLMMLLGHSTLEALEKYAHYQKAYLVEKINMVQYPETRLHLVK